MMDPFNPRPGSPPGEESHERDYRTDRGGGKTPIWVPAVFFGGVGLLILVASL